MTNEDELSAWNDLLPPERRRCEGLVQAVLVRHGHRCLAIEVDRKLKMVYTPMHGVGGRSVVELFERAGYPKLHPVEEQFAPDGEFPTVRFPNPEEEGAMDLSIALAEQVGADLVLANDPDADRLALADRPPGLYSMNEVLGL